jgi:hypothetical protein
VRVCPVRVSSVVHDEPSLEPSNVHPIGYWLPGLIRYDVNVSAVASSMSHHAGSEADAQVV